MIDKLLKPVIVYGALISGINAETLLKKESKSIRNIDTKELVKILKEKPNIKIIDVRTRADILGQGGFLKVNKRTNIQRSEIEILIPQTVDKDEVFVVHGYDGTMSTFAAKRILDMGYKKVLHYKGSYLAWNKAGLKTYSLDYYPKSMLFRPLEKVADGVYTSIGSITPGNYENSGQNNNLGFVVGDKSVLVWNAGSNYLLAKAFHEELKKITDKPVEYVVIENSQSHASLGSSYWKEQGAKIVSQELAKKELMAFGDKILERKVNTMGDKMLGTRLVIPDITFKDDLKFDLGDRIVVAKYFGYAHEHSDISLWLPKEKILFAGDLAFHQRLLPIFKITETLKWLESWEKLAALKAEIVIPGHGDVTDMLEVTKYTKDYIVYMRAKLLEVLDNDGDLNDAYNIDLSAYEHLGTFKELSKQNIARLFAQLEFEE